VAVQHGEKEGRGVAPAKTAESRGGGGQHSLREGERWSSDSKSGVLGGGHRLWGGQMAPGSVRDDNGCSVLVTFTRMKEVE
jgi:hypothetical protein